MEKFKAIRDVQRIAVKILINMTKQKNAHNVIENQELSAATETLVKKKTLLENLDTQILDRTEIRDMEQKILDSVELNLHFEMSIHKFKDITSNSGDSVLKPTEDCLQSRLWFLQQDFITFLNPEDFISDIKGFDGIYSLNDVYGEKGTMFCQQYFKFIINFLNGELMDVLETLQICRYLYGIGCLTWSDMEHIKTVHSTTGRKAACQELCITVRGKRATLALLVVEAILAIEEYNKVKIDTSLAQENFEIIRLMSQQDSGGDSPTPIQQEDHELQDNLQSRVLSLQQDFIKFLKPSDVMSDIQGLDDCFVECRYEEILVTEKTSREQAVKDLFNSILKNSDLLPKFVFALQARDFFSEAFENVT